MEDAVDVVVALVGQTYKGHICIQDVFVNVVRLNAQIFIPGSLAKLFFSP